MGYSAPDLGAALRLCAFTHTLIQYCTATTLNTWERGAARVEKAEVVFFFFFPIFIAQFCYTNLGTALTHGISTLPPNFKVSQTNGSRVMH